MRISATNLKIYDIIKLVRKMDYKVLYRKYRPADFSSIIGQDYMVSILKNSLKKNKISHAYIFSGPRGTGKTSTAKVFAKAINCLNPTENGPCLNCSSCQSFQENADIIEIDAASNNGVDEIREIINNIKLAPAYSKYKVYIIDEVHMLSTSAFNALLLTLEEPPKHVVFILATTNIEAVPITILSRCQRFDFHKISLKDIIKRLEYVVKEENIAIDSDALEEIAYISDGGLRDALSILDQLSSNNTQVTINDVIAHFGSVSNKQINDLYNYIINNEINKFIMLMDNFKNIAIDYKLLIKKLLEKIEKEAIKCKKEPNYLGLPYNKLKELAFELASISNYINININPYLLIEITLLNYFPGNNSNSTISKDTPLFPPKDEKPKIESSPTTLTKPKEELEKLINIRINNCFYGATKENLQVVRGYWPDFIADFPDKKLLNLIIDSNIAAASDKIIIITNPIEGTVNLINKELNKLAFEFNQKFNTDYKFVALTDHTWQLERQKYINNLKNKVTYTYIEEPTKESNNNLDPSIDSIEKVALEIFDKDKIEIE